MGGFDVTVRWLQPFAGLVSRMYRSLKRTVHSVAWVEIFNLTQYLDSGPASIGDKRDREIES